MVTITLGRWQMAGLVTSLLLLVLLSAALGFAANSLPMPAAPSQPGVPPAAGEAREKTGSNPPMSQSANVRREVLGAAESMGEASRETAKTVLDPVTQATSSVAQRLLPPWVAKQAQRVVNREAYLAVGKAKRLAEGTTERALNAGVDGDVSAFIPASVSSAAVPAVVARRYTVELGRFASAANAESFAASAARRGIECAVEYAPENGQPAPYAVRAGRFPDADAAAARADALKSANGIAATVVALAETGARPSP